MKNGVLGAVITGVLVIGGITGGVICTEKIEAGYVGIQYNMKGGVENEVLTQGWHIVSPTKKVREYSVSTEQAFLKREGDAGDKDDESFLIPSKDGKTLNVDLEFSYHFDAEKLPQTYTRFKGQSGKDIEQTFVKSKMKVFATEVSSKFSVLDIYGEKRTDLNKTLYDYSKKNFQEYGIIVDSVNFSRIDVDAQTSKAIQDRINAQQQLEKQKIELETSKIQVEKSKIEAQGKAEVTRINAEAEAKANKLKQSTLNDTIVKYEAVKRWNGTMPSVMGSDSVITQMLPSTQK